MLYFLNRESSQSTISDEDNNLFEISNSSNRSSVQKPSNRSSAKKPRSIKGTPTVKKPTSTFDTPIDSVNEAGSSESEHDETLTGDPHDLSHLVDAVELMSNKLCNNKLVLSRKCSIDLYKSFCPAKSVLHKMTSKEFKIVFDACFISTTLCYFKMPWACQINDNSATGKLRQSQELSSSVLSYFMEGTNNTELSAVVDMLTCCYGRKKQPHIHDNYFYKHWHTTLPKKVDDAIVQVFENMPSEFIEILNNNNEWIQDLMSM